MIERLVTLSGSKAQTRPLLESLTDAQLRLELEFTEAAVRDIARYGRLGAIWSHDGSEIVPPEEVESWFKS